MTGLAILVLVSALASLFGYWRALRLHLRIVDIEPQFRGLVTQFLDRICTCKEKRHD